MAIYLITYLELSLRALTALTCFLTFLFVVSRGVQNIVHKFFLTSTEQWGSSQQYSVTLAS